MLIGGTGNDTITTGGGADVIGFNKGDGADIVNASVGTDDTLSLGGAFAYSDLKLKKTGLDLILDASNGDQITFKNWYQTGVNNKSVLNLQVVADAMAAFNPAGSRSAAEQEARAVQLLGHRRCVRRGAGWPTRRSRAGT